MVVLEEIATMAIDTLMINPKQTQISQALSINIIYANTVKMPITAKKTNKIPVHNSPGNFQPCIKTIQRSNKMKLGKKSLIAALILGQAILITLIQLPAKSSDSNATTTGRERLLMDSDWRFALGHAYDMIMDFKHGISYFSYLTKTGYGDGPAAANFDDRAWRTINLPHDWAVEMPFDSKGSHSHGYKAVGRAFPETASAGIAKSFLSLNRTSAAG